MVCAIRALASASRSLPSLRRKLKRSAYVEDIAVSSDARRKVLLVNERERALRVKVFRILDLISARRSLGKRNDYGGDFQRKQFE